VHKFEQNLFYILKLMLHSLLILWTSENIGGLVNLLHDTNISDFTIWSILNQQKFLNAVIGIILIFII
jgi:hypothetical protein